MKKVQSLGRRLAGLQPGERSWFWYSPDSPELPLLMEKFADPKGMERLLRRAASLPLPGGARVCTGISAVSDDGTIQFGSPIVEEWMLVKLSLWVHRNVAAVPELSYLRDAVFLQVDPSGAVRDRFSDPELWEGISAPSRPGTLGHAAGCLDGLEPGADLWLWLAHRGETPLAVTVPTADDPSGEAFAALVAAGRARLGSMDPGFRGIARRLSSGSLLVTAQDDLGLSPAVEAWLQERGEVRLVQLRDGEIVTGRRVGAAGGAGDLSAQLQALASVAAGETCAFWFSAEAKGGGPLLLLESSPAALKPLAVEAATDAPAVRGKLVAARWGVEFQTRKAIPGFIAALAAWVAANRAHAAGLDALVGARMTVRDRDGNTTERIRDDGAWAPLQNNRGQ